MKTFKLFIIVASVGLLSSCMQRTWIQKTGKTTEVKESMITHVPVVADLKVNAEKVSGTYSSSKPEHSLEYVKDMAIAEAITAGNYDLLLEPNFEVRVTGPDKTAIVKGYPAKYTNFRNFVPSDTVWMNLGKSRIVSPIGGGESTVTKTKPASPKAPAGDQNAAKAVGAGLGSLLLLGLVIALIASL
jgi:hypothetical protein